MRPASGSDDLTLAPLPATGLAVLYCFTGFALLGYASFGLHPTLLVRFPQVAGFYGVSFLFFAQAQIWLAWVVLALFLALHARARWVPAFMALYLISLSSELLGTGVGIPFGEYRYTDALGPKWFGRVPVVISLSWFFMALPSYAVALAAFPRHAAPRVVMASMVLLSWDLALDPAMSRATVYWVWAEPGAYYGMPWLNLFGWYVTGLALMTALALLGADRWIARLPLRWLVGFYGANLLLPLGMSAAAGLWGAVTATLGALAGAALLTPALAWWMRPRGEAAEARA
jgi:putative membrane protein